MNEKIPFNPSRWAGRKLGTPQEEADRVNRIFNVWEEYERRKAEVARTATSTAEYDRRVREIADELGI